MIDTYNPNHIIKSIQQMIIMVVEKNNDNNISYTESRTHLKNIKRGKKTGGGINKPKNTKEGRENNTNYSV